MELELASMQVNTLDLETLAATHCVETAQPRTPGSPPGRIVERKKVVYCFRPRNPTTGAGHAGLGGVTTMRG